MKFQPQLGSDIEAMQRAAEAVASTDLATLPIDPVALIVPLLPFDRLSDIAAPAFSTLRGSDAQTVIVVSPGQSHSFRRMTIPPGEVYHTAMCDMPLDDLIRNELCDEDDDIYADTLGHDPAPATAHLPFVRAALPDASLVPIVMGEETPDFCRELATALAEIMFNKSVVLIATVGTPEGEPEVLDLFERALADGNADAIQRLHVNGDIKMVGFGALQVVLRAAAERRASAVDILSGVADGITAVVSRRT